VVINQTAANTSNQNNNVELSSEHCNCNCHCTTSYSNNNEQQTQSVENANRFLSSKKTVLPSHVFDHSNATSSMSTPPQLITSSNLNLGPPQKQKTCLNKRQPTAKPLFGQNTTNNLSKIPATNLNFTSNNLNSLSNASTSKFCSLLKFYQNSIQ
jgi:hypothetical protein